MQQFSVPARLIKKFPTTIVQKLELCDLLTIAF